MKHARLIVVVGLNLLTLLSFSPAFAGHSVDPSTLNPSPFDISPPGAIITCQATGQGPHCTGTVAFSSSAFPSGLFCSGVELLEAQAGSGNLDLWYNQDGSVTKLINHWSKPAGPGNTISDPATGQSVGWSASYNFNATFPTPGDFSTWIRSFDGRADSVVLPGGGVLLHDAGTQMYGPDGLIQQGGPLDFVTAINNGGSLPALCTALGA